MTKKFDVYDLLDFIDSMIGAYPQCEAVLRTVKYRVEKLRDEKDG